MICEECGEYFEPSKKDERIKFCSRVCRLENRKKTGYSKKYYKENITSFKKRQQLQEVKDKKNRLRRERYANDKEYREKTKAKVKEYNLRNPKTKAEQRMAAYGITVSIYNEMLESQNGKCAICGSLPSSGEINKKLYVDHCHETNKARGLLCTKCNFALGQMNDDIGLLKKAIKYLEKHNG